MNVKTLDTTPSVQTIYQNEEQTISGLQLRNSNLGNSLFAPESNDLMPLYQLCCLVEEEVRFFLFFPEQQNVLFKILAA